MRETGLAIIGSGPGGYVAGIRAAQRGMKVTLIESDVLGGVCLNAGCIPSKALTTLAQLKSQAQHFQTAGLVCNDLHIDFPALMDHKDKTRQKLRNGVSQLLKANGAEIIAGAASFKDAHTLSIKGEEACELHFEKALIATGGHPDIGDATIGGRLITTSQLLEVSTLPTSLIIVGADIYGLELAQTFAVFGSQVSLVIDEKKNLSGLSKNMHKALMREMKAMGIKIINLKDGQYQLSQTENAAQITYTAKGEAARLEAAYVVLALGRKPNSAKLNLKAAGVAVDEAGYIMVDQQGRTKQKHIWAIGDVVKGLNLAHRASYEGKVAIDAMQGFDTIIDYLAMPVVLYTQPEIAFVGLSEAEAKAMALNVKVKKFPYSANGRALTLQAGAGFIQILAQADTGRLLGAEIMGPGAIDMITELNLAIEAGLTVEDLALTVHPHPSLAENIMEVSEAWLGSPVHTL